MHNILLVDDSWAIRNSLRRLLEAHGWHVSGEAENGLQGIELAEKLRPDLIVMDLSMPVMNGLEASRQLKAQMPDVPIVMFTSYVTPQVYREAEKAGVDAIVGKAEGTVPILKQIQRLSI